MGKKKKVQQTSMHDFMEIFRLRFEMRLSFRVVAQTLGIGCSTVHDIIGRFNNLAINWPLPEDYPADRLEKMLFPGREYQQRSTSPDWLVIDTELARKGVTKQLLWLEYQAQAGPEAISYSRFCAQYRQWKKAQRRSMRQEHKAGEKLFIDFCGPTVPIINPETGEEQRAAIFVAVMGASNYTYVEACEGQDMASWLNANSRCLLFLGGVPELLVPDNLKSSVSKADRYEPVLNSSYQALAAHYQTALLPTRPYKPKDKAKAEVGVLIVERWILVRLRYERFYTLASLNRRLRELNHELNQRPMKGYGGQSRAERFHLLDSPALKPLPSCPYEYKEYKRVKVAPDYHVEYDHHCYSVPHEFVGERLELKASQRVIQIYIRGRGIAQHPRSSLRYKHTTHAGHMPVSHRQHARWTPERLLGWAASIGPGVLSVVQSIQQSKPHSQQSYRAILGVLSLQKKYGAERLEKASQIALRQGRPHRVFLENLLKHHRENPFLEPHQEETASPALLHENLRGPGYYH